MTPEQKKLIDGMSHRELATAWRFAKIGDSLLQGDCGIYFQNKLRDMGGITAEISKEIGWGKIC